MGSPITLMILPRVSGPTGTRMGLPVSLTGWPRTRPSVESRAMVLTLLPPKCWATSRTSLLARLIVGFLARRSQMNTRVLCSSMVLMADSLLKGCLMMLWGSNALGFLTPTLRAIGFCFWVLQTGRLKVVLVQTLTLWARCFPFFTF